MFNITKLLGAWLSGGILLVNLVVRLAGLHDQGNNIPLLVLSVATLFLLFFLNKRNVFKWFCFIFGLSFPFYCFQTYTVYNQFFEFLIVIMGGLAWFRHRSYDAESVTINKGVVVFLWSCVLLACSSLLLFPVSQIVRLLSLWGPCDFCSAVLSATPENALYAVAAVNRLVLFFVVIFLLSSQSDAKKYYKKIFQGVITGALLTTVAGVLNQLGILDLGVFRPQFHAPSGVPRLHSVAGNPGWFAQYLIGSLPFIFLLIPKNKGLFFQLTIVTMGFLFCGAALLLTASRTSWLLFPVVAVAGYLYLFFFGSGTNPNRFKGKKSLRTGLFMAALFCAVGLCVIGAFFFIVQPGTEKGPAGSVTRTQYILHRLENIVTPGERLKVWRESLVLGSENPVFGMGYEGYKWHQRVMSSIPGSRFARSRQTINNWDTPHSFFLQLFISNGIAGVIVWIFLIFYVLYLIFQDAWFYKSSLSMMCFVSILLYLLYGLTQSLQYISMIWFVFFLQIGYAMTLADRHVYPVAPRLRTVAAALSILLTVIGTGLYANHAQSHNLAARYKIPRYSDERVGVRYNGFYAKEDWGNGRIFRWSGRKAEIVVNRPGVLGFSFVCNAPTLAQDPIVLEVALGDKVLDHYTFWSAETITRYYWIPPVSEPFVPRKLKLSVSKTWNPKLTGIADDARNLGVAVSLPLFQGTVLPRDIGLSAWQIGERQDAGIIRYQWTNRIAVLNLRKYHGVKSMALGLKSTHPFIENNPVGIKFVQKDRVIAEMQLKDHYWNRLALPGQVDYTSPLTIEVNRTWNPRRSGYADDPRDLGISVALLQKD